jgi:cell division protein FtsW
VGSEMCIRDRYILLPIGLGFLLFLFAVVTTPYRLMRIKILLHPENYIQTTGKYSSYQLVQAFVAFAKGKLTGLGIGEGIQAKFQFLTYAYSDFMYAHIAEEVGALGAILILLLFLFILYSGLSIADRTDEQIGKYLALGLTTYIFLQAVVHIGVNIGLLPTTGITLPFMSAGGSSLISNFLAVGVLMAVAKSLPSESKVKARVVGKGRYA